MCIRDSTWAEHAERTVIAPEGTDAITKELRTLVSAEATGLPVTYLACGGSGSGVLEATMASQQVVGGRAWARQVLRERMLNRWLAE